MIVDCRRAAKLVALFAILLDVTRAQVWDVPGRLAESLSESTGGRFKLAFEQRGRYEERTGNSFGKDVDVATGFLRTRVGLSVTPVSWLRFSGTVQDARAPWYGDVNSTGVRDQADLYESYIELFPGKTSGFGATAGRMSLSYGDGRLLSTPQWGNLSRSFDHARLYWRSPKAQFEVLLVSPVKMRCGEFNRPVFGDRLWGTYNRFPDFYKSNLLEVYLLRRTQNRTAGFTGGSSRDGSDRLGITTFGFRLAGPLAPGARYTFESAFQQGKIGPAEMGAGALALTVTRRWSIGGKPLDITGEYKYASGTFDQLFASNHDRFGHMDLIGWRNLHNARSLATLGVTRTFALNGIYDNFWLASSKDALYNGSGKAIARSAAGTGGRHVGQELDFFGTSKYRHFTFGAGYGRFFSGPFIRHTTPGLGPTYIYVFHNYSL